MSPVAVITGASAGVGRACARAFAGAGYDVALLARGWDGLEAAAKEAEAAGVRALPLVVDVADHEAVEDAAAQVEERLGPVDVWVNNAFTGVLAEFLDVSPDEFKRVTDVTYMGYVHGTRAALTRMLERDRGVVVQVGSALAYRGIPLQAAYCGAKHAIQGFNESVRCELMHRGANVQVVMVQMPALNTPQFTWALARVPRHPQPVKPIYQPEVAARAVLHAAQHPRRRERWVGASTVGTIVANAVVPGLLERYLARTGVKGQQTDQPLDPARPVNLWHPVDDDGGDYGAHGEFDAVSKPRSLQWAAAELVDRLLSRRR